jgi:hypothetical protein
LINNQTAMLQSQNIIMAAKSNYCNIDCWQSLVNDKKNVVRIRE